MPWITGWTRGRNPVLNFSRKIWDFYQATLYLSGPSERNKPIAISLMALVMMPFVDMVGNDRVIGENGNRAGPSGSVFFLRSMRYTN